MVVARVTAFEGMTDEQVRAVRDDRMKIGDELFKIVTMPIGDADLRILVNTYITTLTASAMNESLKRIDAALHPKAKDSG